MCVQPSDHKESETIASSHPWFSDWWTPAISAAVNNKAYQVCTDLSVEWQAFVGRRIKEDLHLLQKLSAARASDDVWNAWSRFWWKVVEDYGTEYCAIARLAAGFVPEGIGANATGEAQPRPPQAKAA
jgi:hypothetical protein